MSVRRVLRWHDEAVRDLEEAFTDADLEARCEENYRDLANALQDGASG